MSALKEIAKEISICKRCVLSKTRLNTVPGVGNPNADLLIIGEGPGADEDREGEPFVGRSGQLLTKILKSGGFEREEIFITNIVKCRPPENRNPKGDEIEACTVYLEAQIAAINPKLIITVGSVATKYILNLDKITKIRGEIFSWRGKDVMPILHPSYLLRNPSTKEGSPKWKTWQDILKAKERLGGSNGRS